MDTPATNRNKLNTKSLYSTGFSHSQAEPSQTHKKLQMRDDCKSHFHAYLSFKERLLRAMMELDPLAILQSGIFEQYESQLTSTSNNHSPSPDKNKCISVFTPSVSDFQTVMRTYGVSDKLKLTQLQRRSQSCGKTTAEQNAVRRAQSQRNVQFIIFANALRQLPRQQNTFIMAAGKNEVALLKQECQIIKIKEENQNLLSQLSQITNKKDTYEQKIFELQSKVQQQRIIIAKGQNQKTDKQLQFLLKQKQLMKRLQQCRQQLEHLREALEQRQQNTLQQVSSSDLDQCILHEGTNIQNLKEKVMNEGRYRNLLSKLSGMQLNARCGVLMQNDQ